MKRAELKLIVGADESTFRTFTRTSDELTDIRELVELVVLAFDNHKGKAGLWFETPNPEIREFTPLGWVRMGRARSLIMRLSNEIQEWERVTADH